MSTSNDRYRQFHHALIVAPEYMALARKERAACSEFVDLATKLDGKSPPDPEEIEMAYVAAVDEARKLVVKGLLTVRLPDDGMGGANKTGAEASRAPLSHQKYEIHPTASIFPMMTDEALNELGHDIQEHGLRDPIVMHEGRVIDGRNRLEGCHRAGVEPTFVDWTGSGSVVSWIISVNVHRRHLTDRQRAVIAAKVAQELEAEAKSRSTQNLRNSWDPVEGLDPGPRGEGKSAATAAKLLNVSRDATNKAARIAKSGSEELVKAVTHGKVSLDAAATVSELPKTQQRKLVEKGEEAAAKKIREAKAVSKASPKNAPKPEPIPEAKDVEPSPPEPASTRNHDSVPKMVAAARRAGRMEGVLKQLRSLVAYCQKQQLEFGEAKAP